MIGVNVKYSSVASSALSPIASKTGVVWVWKPVIVFGLPAWPTTSTACKVIGFISFCFQEFFDLFNLPLRHGRVLVMDLNPYQMWPTFVAA